MYLGPPGSVRRAYPDNCRGIILLEPVAPGKSLPPSKREESMAACKCVRTQCARLRSRAGRGRTGPLAGDLITSPTKNCEVLHEWWSQWNMIGLWSDIRYQVCLIATSYTFPQTNSRTRYIVVWWLNLLHVSLPSFMHYRLTLNRAITRSASCLSLVRSISTTRSDRTQQRQMKDIRSPFGAK